MSEDFCAKIEASRERLKKQNGILKKYVEKVKGERDALADAIVEMYVRHAIDSNCRPSSITAKAIAEMMGDEKSERWRLLAAAFERRKAETESEIESKSRGS